MLEAGNPAASFIKFTTNLLSAAIKDAVFVEGNGHSSDKVLRGKRKAHSCKAHPERAGQPARRPSPAAAAATALARWRLLPNFPQRFPAPIPIRQRERERRREGAASAGLMRRQRPIERTAVVVRPPPSALSLLRPSVRRGRDGDNGDRSAVRPLIID